MFMCIVWKEGSKGYANLNLYNYRFPCEFSLERMRENGVYEEEMRRELKRKSCQGREKEETKKCEREETLPRE